MRIEEYKAKSLVSQSYPSPFAWIEYTFNPYQGCWHDCKYCDGKSERYHMHDDFGNVLRVKENADKLLADFFRKKGYYSQSMENRQLSLFDEDIPKKDTFTVLAGGGVCDVYQPAERKVRLMRRCLQTAYDYGIPVILITKSKYVLDDIDLLKKINEQNYAAVHITITLDDEEKQKLFEPRASTTTERFETLKKLREEGIHGGIYSLPVLPFIGDTHENVSALYQRALQAGAEFVYSGSLTLTPGRNKEEFLSVIATHMPELLEKYKRLYSNRDQYGAMDQNKKHFYGIVEPELLFYKYGYETKIPFMALRYIPKGRIETNLKVSEVLVHAGYLYQHIFRDYRKVKQLYQSAYLLDKLKVDVLQMSRKEILGLSLSEDVRDYLSDYFLNGRSKKVEELKKKAYEKTIGMLNKNVDMTR
ncbi:MAG: radical SAM protein [Clostridiales bacterium]|nr:radical SAM protein [Clostridiales bacterium]